IISEIVRSTANVSSGATNRLSNLFHGIFIFVFILLFPQFLSKIPLTAFAAVLIFVGFRLANPLQLIHVYQTGQKQIFIFLITLITTLSTDLLIGIFTGTIVEFLLNAWQVKKPSALFQMNPQLKESTE